MQIEHSLTHTVLENQQVHEQLKQRGQYPMSYCNAMVLQTYFDVAGILSALSVIDVKYT